MNSAKKRRIDLVDEQHKVTIAQYNDNGTTTNDNKFDRSHPHLEGRWVGHIHLPLPSFDSLDLLQQVDEGTSLAVHHDDQTRGGTTLTPSDEQSNSQSSDDESSNSSSSSDDDDMPQSRMFLPVARRLIHRWAEVLRDSPPNDTAASDDTVSDTVIVPLIPMEPIQRTNTSSKKDAPLKSKSESTSESSHLHISLSRPIYLPSPSVNPFLSDIQKNLSAVIHATNSRRRGSSSQSTDRIVNVQPQNTMLLTNDTATRTFLCIPISISSSNWIKKSLLPVVDATMLKFGLLSYYNNNNNMNKKEEGRKGEDSKGKDGEGGCILHVSIASVYGNVIPQMLFNRNNNTSQHNNNNNQKNVNSGDVEKIRCIPLFSSKDQEEGTIKEGLTLPSYIPIRVNCIQCEFGKMKKLTIPL